MGAPAVGDNATALDTEEASASCCSWSASDRALIMGCTFWVEGVAVATIASLGLLGRKTHSERIREAISIN